MRHACFSSTLVRSLPRILPARRLTEHGFDHSIDYKVFDTQEKVVAELKRIAPNGVDLYFDNTGGHVTDAFFDVVRPNGHAAVCGSISAYNAVTVPLIPSFLSKIIYTSVTVKGSAKQADCAGQGAQCRDASHSVLAVPRADSLCARV
jgi:NADPH-dependent curcumin reductase CurA